MLHVFATLIYRDIRLALRQGTDSLGTILFFILAIALFPLALGPSLQLLHRIGFGIIWVCALLAALFPLERLFHADFEDGSLEQMLLLGQPPAFIAFTKMVSHWLITGIPLIVTTLPIMIMLGLPLYVFPMTMLALTATTLSLSFIGGAAASLTLGARKSSLLLPLLILPLITPILIFGVATIDTYQAGLNFLPNLEILGACVVLSLPLCPLAAGYGLAAAIE